MAEQKLPSWWNTVEQHSATAGVDSNVLRKFGSVESAFKNVDNYGGTSSATGPFQIVEGTWNGLAQRYPHLQLNNRRDPEQQAKAAPYYLREVKDILAKAAGRDPTDGEQYLGWFLGPHDAAKVLKADPSTDIRKVVSPASIAANQGVFSKISTVADMAAWGSRKMNDKGASLTGTEKYGDGPSFPRGKVDVASVRPPDPYTDHELYARQKKQEEDSYGYLQGAYQAISQESTLRWAFESNGAQPPDPKFVVTQDLLKERAADIPTQHLGYLGASHSLENFEWRKQQLLKDIEVERRLDAMGVPGVGLRILGAAIDPGGWLAAAGAGLALGPAGAGAAASTRFGRILMGAAEGAAGNLAVEGVIASSKPTWERDQLLYAAGGGLAFGAAFGAFRSPAITDEVTRLGEAGKALSTSIEQGYGNKSAGAASSGGVESVRTDISEYLSKRFDETYGERGAFSAFRWDVTNKLKSSDNPLVRALGNVMGEETVGQADKTKATFRALTEDQVMVQRRYETEFSSAYSSAWDDYRKRNGLGWTAGMNGQETRFRQEITAAVRNTDGAVQVDPAVARVAAKWREINDQYLKLAKGDHGSLDGTTRTPLKGFQNVEPNENYVPRLVHWDRYRTLLNDIGTDNMEELLYRAVVGKNPDLEERIARKIARGYNKRLASVDAGQELTASRMFSGLDTEMMRQELRDAGLLDDEIERALWRATARDEAKAGISRGKPRQLLDENFRMEVRTKNGTREVRLAELYHDDAMHLFSSYNRQMSGAIAMQRLQLKNPNWTPEDADIHSQYLVDGIHGPGDWEKLMAQVRAVAQEAGGKARDTREGDVANLQFLYEGIMGMPSRFDRENPRLAQWLRRFRDYNFIRVMNQVGFAQVAEVGMITGQLGLKAAIQSMPSLKALMRDAKTGKLLDEDARALEWISTAGTDTIRGVGHLVTDDFGAPVTHTGGGAAIDGVLQRGAHITSHISGMSAINAYLQRWASKGVLHKFLDMSEEGASVNRQRLRVLGLDDKMQDKIFAEIRKHKGTMAGETEGSTIGTLKLHEWEPEVRGAFEHAIFRWTRKIIQENDLGQANIMLGSTLGKIFFQFRNFMLGAWTKNTLHNIHMRDWESMSMILGTMTFGALAYTAQTHLQSIGRPDREEFLKKRLDEKKLAFAAFQRSGFSSLFPMVADNGMYLAGMDPLFDTRVTGQPSQGLMSFAGASLIDNAMNATRGVAGATHGDPYSQRDWRALMGVLPFSNAFPMLWFTNSVAQSLPERDPRPGQR